MYSIWVYKYRPTLVKRLLVLFNIDKSCVETKIDPHAHVERDKSQIVALEVTINFNSHAHVERDSIRAKIFLSEQFQLTRSRGA